MKREALGMEDGEGHSSNIESDESHDSQHEQHEQRVHALHELAQQQLGEAPPANPSVLRRSSRRRRGMVALSAVLLIAVVAAVVWRITRPPTASGRANPPVVTITPSADNIYCPTGVAWSPDSTRVAVLGYTAVCPPQSQSSLGTNSGIVNVYDVRTGHLVLTFQPDSIILNAHGVSLPLVTASSQQGPFGAFLRYDDVLWSGDGQQLALPFYVQTGFYQRFPPYQPAFDSGNPPAPAPTLAGVLLTDIADGAQRVLSAHYADSGARLEWDLTNSTLLSSTVTLPPALGYTWGANGALLPQTPLNTKGPPSVSSPLPVGNSMGGSSFSLWQSGVAAPALYALNSSATPNASPQYTSAPNVYMWYSNFGAWSPDGRYLLTTDFAGARVVVPGLPAPSAAALAAAHLAATPIVSARDAALSSAYGEMASFETNASVPGVYSAPQVVAWRPDGRVAAMTPYLEGLSSPSGGKIDVPPVTLDASATGNTLAMLKPQTNSQTATGFNSLSGQNIWLQWSPDGKHLLLLDNTISTLTIWNAAALPNV